jgi:hypothetical protein
MKTLARRLMTFCAVLMLFSAISHEVLLSPAANAQSQFSNTSILSTFFLQSKHKGYLLICDPTRYDLQWRHCVYTSNNCYPGPGITREQCIESCKSNARRIWGDDC